MKEQEHSSGWKVEIDLGNQHMRVILQEGEADDVFTSPNGIARCGISFDGRDTIVKWVEMYDERKTTLMMDWIEMAIEQALGGEDDYWKPSFEIVPIVRVSKSDNG